MNSSLSTPQLFRELIEASADGIMITDQNCIIIEINSAFTAITGYMREDILGKHPRFMKSDRHSHARYTEQIKSLITSGHWDGECWGLKKNGEQHLESLSIRAVYDDDRKLNYYVYVFKDKELRLNARVFDSTNDGIIITDDKKMILSVNPAFTKLTGYSYDESIGKSPNILSSGDQDKEFYDKMWDSINHTGNWKGEIWNKKKNGEKYPEWLSINRIMNDHQEVTHYIGIFSDISERKRSEENLVHLAHSDALTGLPNRLLFVDRLKESIHRAERTEHKVAVLFIDLDRFKAVNDTLGHAIGDLLLKEVANRLNGCIHKSDTLARVGGDEFTMILPDFTDRKNIIKVANHIIKQINEPFHLEDHEVFITTSIGISVYPDDAIQVDELLRNADAAMYQAKQHRNQFEFHSSELLPNPSRSKILEKSIKKGLRNNQFKVFYQPQKDIHNRGEVRYEALLRWVHPDLGMIMPSEFIPIAEKNDEFLKLGEWAIHEACLQIKRLEGSTLHQIKIFLNLSVNQLQQRNFVGMIKRIIKQTEISPKSIGFEITENIQTGQLKSILKKLHAFRQMGIDIALDNFGGNFSTLSYINQYPISILKIDKDFIHKLDKHHKNKVIIQALVKLAHELDLEVVAEGVESEKQLECLITMGCDYVQGFLISQPLEILPFNHAYI
jgi:diguanylate cyclase (GGDEF)-like protein/PAS domain S-box-containing protein